MPARRDARAGTSVPGAPDGGGRRAARRQEGGGSVRPRAAAGLAFVASCDGASPPDVPPELLWRRPCRLPERARKVGWGRIAERGGNVGDRSPGSFQQPAGALHADRVRQRAEIGTLPTERALQRPDARVERPRSAVDRRRAGKELRPYLRGDHIEEGVEERGRGMSSPIIRGRHQRPRLDIDTSGTNRSPRFGSPEPRSTASRKAVAVACGMKQSRCSIDSMSSIVAALTRRRTLSPNASRTKADTPAIAMTEIIGGALPRVPDDEVGAIGGARVANRDSEFMMVLDTSNHIVGACPNRRPTSTGGGIPLDKHAVHGQGLCGRLRQSGIRAGMRPGVPDAVLAGGRHSHCVA